MMNRTYFMIATALLVLGLLFDWRLSRAHEHDRPASALQPVHQEANSEVAELTGRIEALEKRLAALEDHRPLVRQADSREAAVEYPTSPTWVAKNPAESGQDANDDTSSQVTNGRKWRFRLLSNENR
jgi:hypothetical protein